MSELVLVRHAATVPDPDRPPAAWPLGSGAAGAVEALARRLRAQAPGTVVTSVEPKAILTGRLLAACLDLPVATAPGLQEHERGHLPVLEERAWRATVRRFFRHPDTLVFGLETASEARARFHRALAAVAAAHPGVRPAVVAHGTVISLVLAEPNGLDPYTLWDSLGMPEALVVAWPELTLLRRLRPEVDA